MFQSDFKILVYIILLIVSVSLAEDNTIVSEDVCLSPECQKLGDLMASYMDNSADPCGNFTAYACGRLIEKRSSYDPLKIVNTRILSEMFKVNSESPEYFQKLRIFLESCIVENSIINQEKSCLSSTIWFAFDAACVLYIRSFSIEEKQAMEEILTRVYNLQPLLVKLIFEDGNVPSYLETNNLDEVLSSMLTITPEDEEQIASYYKDVNITMDYKQNFEELFKLTQVGEDTFFEKKNSIWHTKQSLHSQEPLLMYGKNYVVFPMGYLERLLPYFIHKTADEDANTLFEKIFIQQAVPALARVILRYRTENTTDYFETIEILRNIAERLGIDVAPDTSYELLYYMLELKLTEAVAAEYNFEKFKRLPNFENFSDPEQLLTISAAQAKCLERDFSLTEETKILEKKFGCLGDNILQD